MEHWEEFSSDFQAVLTENFAEYKELTAKIEAIDESLGAQVIQSEDCRRLMQISGIGPLTATALGSALIKT